ncbi:unnamed protein product [Linum trigynum]|uniref:Uncharacterized protein n=1 Tax=Linum trigynum TaxID=586398 RepID=A0AAV2ERF7_9ROSI
MATDSSSSASLISPSGPAPCFARRFFSVISSSSRRSNLGPQLFESKSYWVSWYLGFANTGPTARDD